MNEQQPVSTVPSVALIGHGYWGKNLARNLHALGALAAVCEPSEEMQQVVRERYPGVVVTGNVEDIWKDPDIKGVVIATPAESHHGLASQALDAGKDVFVEKPLALNVADGEDLVQRANQNGAILMVGHLMEYHPAIIRLTDMVHQGDLGKIRYIYSNRLNWGKVRREENILWSFAPHDIAIILKLTGEMPDMVTARGAGYVQPHVADVTVTHLSFPSGVRSHIFVSWLHPYKEQRLVVVGENKVAVFEDSMPDGKLRVYPHSIDWEGEVAVARKADAEIIQIDETEPLRLECQSFLDAINTRVPPRTHGESGLRVLQVLSRCQESLVSSGGEAETPV